MNDQKGRVITIFLRVFCAIPFLTGLADLIGGTSLFKAAGIPMPPEVASDPFLNSQIKFWGAIFFGYGAMLWWAAGDIRGRAQTLQLLLATMVLAGFGRALSLALYGSPGVLLDGALVLEVVGFPLIWLYHRRILRSELHDSTLSVRPGTF